MKHTEYEWISDEKKRIFARSWVPHEPIKGIINLVHGLGEHSGRYASWASLFVENGWGMLVSDLVGNGLSDGRQGHVSNYGVFMNQIDLLIRKSEKHFPGKPRILYGHSMGGNLVINYAISRDPSVHALVASSPWFKPPAPLSKGHAFLIRLANYLLPGLHIRWPKNPESVTHDPQIQEEIRKDPLNHGFISARLAWEVYRHGLFALRHVYKINKPFLLMHGSGDPVASYRTSEEFVANTSERTRLKIWDNLYHNLHNEPEYHEIFEYVMDWIDELKLK